MQAMLDALEVGDSIETSGGLFGAAPPSEVKNNQNWP